MFPQSAERRVEGSLQLPHGPRNGFVGRGRQMTDGHGLEAGRSRFQGTHYMVTAFRVGALVLEMGVNSAYGGLELGQRSGYLGLNPKRKPLMALDIAVGADEYLHLNSPFFIHRHKGNRPDAAGSKWPV
jgi:hypothetical protein